MPECDFNNLQEFLTGWRSNQKYFEMLKMMACLSKLFSESAIPYLDYRLAENMFCQCFNAINDARSCTAYDARIKNVGIGIKTFILNENDTSLEKIAEFNRLQSQLKDLKHKALACRIAKFRNDRLSFADGSYNVNERQYHIVGRKKGMLRIFNCPYEEIDIENIYVIKDNDTSLHFTDNKNSYSYNKSKSVLQMNFCVPTGCYEDVGVEIIDSPIELLEQFFRQAKADKVMSRGQNYVVLPLYSVRDGRVPQKSGLNQWNAGGRKRATDEIYIPVPMSIHKNYPDFFPKRDTPFNLYLPDGKVLSAKICQDGGKALMSNPNVDLGRWLLRHVLKKQEGELVTTFDLDRYGFDSVCVEKLATVDENGTPQYRILFSETRETYEDFISRTQ